MIAGAIIAKNNIKHNIDTNNINGKFEISYRKSY